MQFVQKVYNPLGMAYGPVVSVPSVLRSLRAIYQSGGSHPEYAKLGLNPYSACSHDCKYCYNKRSYLHKGSYDQPTKKASLKNILNDLMILDSAGDKTPVHISFMGDPYDVSRKDNSYMRSVLKRFRAYDHPFQILTKGGMLAAKDFDLYGPDDWFGVTLTFDNDADSKQWEPVAALPAERIAALNEAQNQGIKTWVSCEPVIDPEQTLNLIERTCEFVDLFWIGKLNHYPQIEAKIDWQKFRSDVEALLQKCSKEPETGYKMKHQLIEAR